MGDINKYFGGLGYKVGYNYQDKNKNVTDRVKYMLNRSLAMFHYENLPDTIPVKHLELALQSSGNVVFCKVNEKLYALQGALGGECDMYNRPTKAIISCPYLKYNESLDIDVNCVVMANDSLHVGLLPLYERYCTILNECDISMILATINSRIQNFLSASDDNTVASAKQFLSDIENGKLGIIAESKLFDSFKVNVGNGGAKGSIKELFELHQYIKGSLYNEIGLNATYNMKKTRVIEAEVEINADNLYPLVDDMLENRREALEKINTMFGTDIKVEFNSSWDYRAYNGEPINTLEDEKEGAATDEATDEVIDETDNDINNKSDVEAGNEATNEADDEAGDEAKDEATNEETEKEIEETDEATDEETKEDEEADGTVEDKENEKEDEKEDEEEK